MQNLNSLIGASCDASKTCMVNFLSKSLPNVDVASILGPLSMDPLKEAVIPKATSKANASVASKGEVASQMGKASAYVKQDEVERRIASSHKNHDAKKSIHIIEPIPSEIGSSSAVVDQINPDYSTRKNYPLSYGFQDEANNWYNVNQETGEIQFVHESGSFFKIDKIGNVTIKMTGSLKFIVDKDYLLQSQNMTEIVKKDYYKHVLGKSDTKVDKAYTLTSLKQTELVETDFYRRVLGSYVVKVSGGVSVY